MDKQLQTRLEEIKAENLGPMDTFTQQILAAVESWARGEGYVKLSPGQHCPTCKCGEH